MASRVEEAIRERVMPGELLATPTGRCARQAGCRLVGNRGITAWPASECIRLGPEHTCGVASKYDSYWAGRLGEIRAAVERAAGGFASVVDLPGLRSAGERRSWYGVAEVCGHGITHTSKAHATALGQMIAATGMCAEWPGFHLPVHHHHGRGRAGHRCRRGPFRPPRRHRADEARAGTHAQHAVCRQA